MIAKPPRMDEQEHAVRAKPKSIEEWINGGMSVRQPLDLSDVTRASNGILRVIEGMRELRKRPGLDPEVSAEIKAMMTGLDLAYIALGRVQGANEVVK